MAEQPEQPRPASAPARSAAAKQDEPPTHFEHDPVTGAKPVRASDARPDQAELDRIALENEKSLARTRGAPEDRMDDWESRLVWVHSNRQDDRVVIYEPDPLHPGGQAFIGGDGPDHVYRTDAIESLLQSGELIEVPAPREWVPDPEDPNGEQLVRNRYYPDRTYTQAGGVAPNMPGQPTLLGRKLNDQLWEEEQLREVQRRQAYMPQYRPVPPGGIVPPAMEAPRGR